MIGRSDMASESRFFTLAVLVFASSCMIHHVQCANYTVGAGFTDSDAGTGKDYTWTNTVNGLVKPDELEENFQKWANSVNVTAGDVLTFDYISGQHTVFLAKTELAYINCDFSAGSLETIPDASPATYTVKQTDGTLYFTCTVPGHCAGGQKVRITPFGAVDTPTAPTPTAGTPSAAHQLKTLNIVMLLLVCCFTLFTHNHFRY